MAELLAQSFYVDDPLMRECNEEKALPIYHRAKKLMTEEGFNLRKWKTNSLEVQRAIAKSESANKSISAHSNDKEKSQEDDESYAKSNTQDLSSNKLIDEDIFVKV